MFTNGGVLLALRRRTADLTEQLCLAVHAAGRKGKEHKHIELLWREQHDRAVKRHVTSVLFHDRVAEAEFTSLGLTTLAPTDHSVDAGR